MLHTFEEKFDTIGDGTSKCVRMRKKIMDVAASVVCVTSYYDERALFTCSGTIINWDGEFGYILTSATLLHYRRVQGYLGRLKVVVKFPNREDIGVVLWHDLHLNIAIVMFKSSEPVEVATFDIQACPCLGGEVVALGRHYMDSELMASYGEVNAEFSQLDCQELLESNCMLTKPGIGGPLINPENGHILGLNFYDVLNTPFLPSSIVVGALCHFELYGRVIQPWLGLKLAGNSSLKLMEEEIKMKFHHGYGLLVKKVSKKSPARIAGLQRGDIIICCAGIQVRSVVEFYTTLLDLSAKYMSNYVGLRKLRKMEVKVVLRRKMDEPMITKTLLVDETIQKRYNSWPLPEEDSI